MCGIIYKKKEIRNQVVVELRRRDSGYKQRQEEVYRR